MLPELQWHNASTVASNYSSLTFNPLDDEDDDIIVYGKQVSSASPNDLSSDISSEASSDSGRSSATHFVHPVHAMLEDLLGPEEHPQDSPTDRASTTSQSLLESSGMALWLSEYMSELVMGKSSAYKW